MKLNYVLQVVAFCLLASIGAKAQPQRNFYESFLLKEKFTHERVWDAQRYPAYPQAGRDWVISGFKRAFDVSNNGVLDWGRFNDRYLMLTIEEDHSFRAGAFMDDVSRTKGKYNVALTLFERDGRFVKVVSKWGDLIGFGATGFMYVQQGVFGTFFSYDMMREGGSVTYRPDVAQIKSLSEIMDDRRQRPHDNFDRVVEQQHERSYTESFLLREKFTHERVWDAQRYPAYPQAGRDWVLSGFKRAFDVSNNGVLDWGRYNDRYLMLTIEEDHSFRAGAFMDDVSRTKGKYNVALTLFERDGRFVKVVSKWGDLIGFGATGFMYVQQGVFGTFFSYDMMREGGSVTYRPDVAQIKSLSEIMDDRRQRPHDNFDNRQEVRPEIRTDNHQEIRQDYRIPGYENHQRFDDKRATFIYKKYKAENVWDAKREPLYPISGRDWKLSGFTVALDISNNRFSIDWGRNRDRYLMFEITDDLGNTPGALIDDVNRTRIKYNVSLNLFESDGQFVKTISRWGKLIGFGSFGFMYEQEGQLGTLFAFESFNAFREKKYITDVSEVRYLSEILR